jgi:HlyD family secretion protein
VAVASIALGVAVGAAGCRRGPEPARAGSLQTATVERRDLDVSVEASGTIEPVRVVEVKSRASGEVLEIRVETGDQVPQGALLAEIDPRDVRNAAQQAQADLEAARARLSVTESQAKRTAELRQARVATQQEDEAATLEAADARAQLVKAQTNLELAREREGDVTIRAPIAGTVIQKAVEEGQIIASASQNVSGGTTLFFMADLSRMQARALVDEIDIGQIAAGQPARVTVESYPGRSFTGRVLKIEPQAVTEQNVTMFPVLILLDNEDGLLKPGMNAEIEVEVARRPGAVVVPNAAVTSPREASTVAAALGLDAAEVRQALSRAAGGGSEAAGNGRFARSPSGAAGEGASRHRTGSEGRDSRAAASASDSNGADQALPATTGQPGVVFLAGGERPEPRLVVLGLSDWDDTEVVSGLEPGQQVVLLSVARLQQQQDQFQQRVQQRAGNPFSTSAGGAATAPAPAAGGRR